MFDVTTERRSAMTDTTMSATETALVRHAIGLTVNARSYSNRFIANTGSREEEVIKGLMQRGLAKLAGYQTTANTRIADLPRIDDAVEIAKPPTRRVYSFTMACAAAVLKKGESLNMEDFD